MKRLLFFFFLSLQWVTFYAVVMNEVLPSPLVLYVFSFGERWVTRPLPHSGNTRARLLLKVVCLVTDFSKKYLAAWQSVFSGILVLAHYVHGRWKQVWRRTRKLSEYFLKCIVRFLASHVELFLRKKKKKVA